MEFWTPTIKYFRLAIAEFIPIIKELLKTVSNQKDKEELEYLLEVYNDIAEKIDNFNLNLENPNYFYKGEPDEINLDIRDSILENLSRLTLRLLNKWKNTAEKLEGRDYLTDQRKKELWKLKELIWPLEAVFNSKNRVLFKYRDKGPLIFPGEKISVQIDKDTYENEDKYDVFLCHSSKDKAIIRLFARNLEEEGVRVWYDEAEILPGDNLINKIVEGLNKSLFVLVFISRNFNVEDRSPFTSWELSVAKAKELSGVDGSVIPVLIDKADTPIELSDKNYADFRDSNFNKNNEEFQRILKKIKQSQVKESN